MDFGGQLFDLRPCGTLGHLHTGFVGQIFAVHQHRAFTIKRCGKQLAIHAQTVAHGGEQIVHVIVGVGFQFLQPAFFAPDRCFVHADGHHVKLTALGGDVGGHALAQHTLFQGDPFEFDVGVGCLKVFGQLLHLDHVAVVDGGNHEFGGRLGQTHAQQRGGQY